MAGITPAILNTVLPQFEKLRCAFPRTANQTILAKPGKRALIPPMHKEGEISAGRDVTLVRFTIYLLAVLLSYGYLNMSGAEFKPFAGPNPTAVLIQTDPWAMVIGSDTPRVAVYEDGTAIFVKKSGERLSYHCKKLSESELSNFKNQLTPVANLKDLKRHYSLLPTVTDQPSALFYIRTGERELVTSVYGLKTSGTRLSGNTSLPGAHKPDDVPKELIELHKFLCSIDYPDSKEWVPDYLEVMIWPYEYAPDVSIVWPKGWPGLDSDRSVKREEGSYSIFLDGTMLPELEKFLKTRKEKGAVKIGGKKWAADFRGVFPSEPVWQKAFQNPQKK